jgi:hypothetical protein
MKSRTPFLLASIFLILLSVIAIFTFSARNQEPLPVFPATINRDCAPWDGSAFTVAIPYDPGSFINISIWREPDIKLPARFSFPDESMRMGSASFLLRFSYSVELTGTVFFWHVEQGSPVEGRFDLRTEAGQRLTGKFHAEWGDQIAMCG